MPLFFFVSGFLFDKKQENPLVIALRKGISLLLPYILFSIINYFLLFFAVSFLDLHTEIFPKSILVSGWGKNPLWFLPVLFLCVILQLLLTNSNVRIALVGAVFILTLFIYKYCTNSWLPYSISEIPWFYSCYYSGYWIKCKIDKTRINKYRTFVPRKVLTGISLILLSLQYIFLAYFILPWHPNYLHDDNNICCIIIKYLLGMNGVFAVLLFSVALSHSTSIIIHGIKWCGRNSIVILCTHFLFYEILQGINPQSFLNGGYNHFLVWILIVFTGTAYFRYIDPCVVVLKAKVSSISKSFQCC